MAYLILEKKRSQDGIACWWRAESAGYTTDLAQAGRYEEAEAKRIAEDSRGQSFAIDEWDLAKLRLLTVIDINYGDNCAFFEALYKGQEKS